MNTPHDFKYLSLVVCRVVIAIIDSFSFMCRYWILPTTVSYPQGSPFLVLLRGMACLQDKSSLKLERQLAYIKF